MQLIDGKATAATIKAEIAEKVKAQVAAGGKRPHLAVVLVVVTLLIIGLTERILDLKYSRIPVVEPDVSVMRELALYCPDKPTTVAYWKS